MGRVVLKNRISPLFVIDLQIVKIRWNSRHLDGFSLTELMIALIVASFIIAGIYQLIGKQRKTSHDQRLKSDTESISQIAFFIIGRDIRRAGSNPAGAMSGSSGAEIPIALAANDQIQILADLNGNGSVESLTDENITYQWVDDPLNPDGIKDQIRRQSGNQLVIENVRNFALSYQLTANSTWIASTANPAAIRVVRMYMQVGTGKIDSQTGVEATKEIQMDYMLRNFH